MPVRKNPKTGKWEHVTWNQQNAENEKSARDLMGPVAPASVEGPKSPSLSQPPTSAPAPEPKKSSAVGSALANWGNEFTTGMGRAFNDAKWSVRDLILGRPDDPPPFSDPDFAEHPAMTKVLGSMGKGVQDIAESAGGFANHLGYENDWAQAAQANKAQINEVVPDRKEDFTWSDMADPEWYATSVARTLPSMLAPLPGVVAGWKIAGAGAKAAGMGTFGRTVMSALGGSAVSAPFESAIEAGSVYNEALQRGMDEASAHAAADSVFKKNLATLGISNAAEFGLAFAPFKAGSALGKIGLGAGKIVGAGAWEGGQEAVQDIFQRQALGDPIAWDAQMKEAVATGAVLGGGMGAVGTVNDHLATLTNNIKNRYNDDLKNLHDFAVDEAKQAGMNDEDAEKHAFDMVSGTEPGKKLIQETVDELKTGAMNQEIVQAPAQPEVVTGQTQQQPIQNPLKQPSFKVGDMAVPTSVDGTHLSQPTQIEDVQTQNGENFYKFAGSNTYMPASQVQQPPKQPAQAPQQPIQKPVEQPPIMPEQTVQQQVVDNVIPQEWQREAERARTHQDFDSYRSKLEGDGRFKPMEHHITSTTPFKSLEEFYNAARGGAQAPMPAVETQTNQDTPNVGDLSGLSDKDLMSLKMQNFFAQDTGNSNSELFDAIEKEEARRRQAKGEPEPMLGYDSYGPVGKKRFRKELQDTGISEDTSDYDDLVRFFDKFYHAGNSGQSMPQTDLHPQQADEFYQAGKKDAEKAKAKNEKQGKQPETKQQPKEEGKKASFKKPWEVSRTEFMADENWKLKSAIESYKNADDIKSSGLKESQLRSQHSVIQPDGKEYPGGWRAHGRTPKTAKGNFHKDEIYWQLRKDAKSVSEDAVSEYPDLQIDRENFLRVRKDIKIENDIVSIKVDGKTLEFPRQKYPAHLYEARGFARNFVGNDREKWETGKWNIEEVVTNAIYQEIYAASEFKPKDRVEVHWTKNGADKWVAATVHDIQPAQILVDLDEKINNHGFYGFEWKDVRKLDSAAAEEEDVQLTEKKPEPQVTEYKGFKLGDFVMYTTGQQEWRADGEVPPMKNVSHSFGTIVEFNANGKSGANIRVDRPYTQDGKKITRNGGWIDPEQKNMKVMNHIPEKYRDQLALVDTTKSNYSYEGSARVWNEEKKPLLERIEKLVKGEAAEDIPGIPTQLQDLADQARQYKTYEDFYNALRDKDDDGYGINKTPLKYKVNKKWVSVWKDDVEYKFVSGETPNPKNRGVALPKGMSLADVQQKLKLHIGMENDFETFINELEAMPYANLRVTRAGFQNLQDFYNGAIRGSKRGASSITITDEYIEHLQSLTPKALDAHLQKGKAHDDLERLAEHMGLEWQQSMSLAELRELIVDHVKGLQGGQETDETLSPKEQYDALWQKMIKAGPGKWKTATKVKRFQELKDFAEKHGLEFDPYHAEMLDKFTKQLAEENGNKPAKEKDEKQAPQAKISERRGLFGVGDTVISTVGFQDGPKKVIHTGVEREFGHRDVTVRLPDGTEKSETFSDSLVIAHDITRIALPDGRNYGNEMSDDELRTQVAEFLFRQVPTLRQVVDHYLAAKDRPQALQMFKNIADGYAAHGYGVWLLVDKGHTNKLPVIRIKREGSKFSEEVDMTFNDALSVHQGKTPAKWQTELEDTEETQQEETTTEPAPEPSPLQKMADTWTQELIADPEIRKLIVNNAKAGMSLNQLEDAAVDTIHEKYLDRVLKAQKEMGDEALQLLDMYDWRNGVFMPIYNELVANKQETQQDSTPAPKPPKAPSKGGKKPASNLAAAHPKIAKARHSLEFLKEARDQADQRVKSRQGRVLSGLPMDDLVDYAIIGAYKIAEKGLDYAEFAAEMLAEYGQNLKLFMRAIHAQAQDILDMSPAEIDEIVNLASNDNVEENVSNEESETSEGGNADEQVDGLGDSSQGPLEAEQADDVQGTSESGQAGGGSSGSTRNNEGTDGGNDLPGDGLSDSVGDVQGDSISSGRGNTTEPVGEPTAGIGPSNYVITNDDLMQVDAKQTTYKRNVAAIRLMQQIMSENRAATKEEQQILIQYVGWGAIAEPFAPAWSKNGWENERKELEELLGPDQFFETSKSILNAHYTSKEVIRAMYHGLKHLGFKGGRVLEPSMGIGNFIGLLPQDIAAKIRVTGIEKDAVTGNIGKLLYPKSDVRISPFEKTNLADNFYDVAIGNVPFGDLGVVDKTYPKELTHRIHNYFFGKALDKVRPGGIVMFITSRYTMDNQDQYIRRHMMQKAEFLGAVRLPNTAFKKNAGTEVTSDIIILQKRDESQPLTIQNRDWMNVVPVEVGDKIFRINEYWQAHPEMIVGEHSQAGNQYGGKDYAVTLADNKDILQEVVERLYKLPADAYVPRTNTKGTEDATPAEMMAAPDDVKPNSYTFKNGKIFYRIGDSLVEQKDIPKDTRERLIGLIEIRGHIRSILKSQMEGKSDSEIKGHQKALNDTYDKFIKKYGYLNTKKNVKAIVEDADAYLILSIEKWDPVDEKGTKGDIFSKQTIPMFKPVEKVDTPEAAMLVSLNELGGIYLEHMAKISGMTESDLTAALEGKIYNDPEQTWVSAEQYLSGNVRHKLRVAKDAAEADESFQQNVAALEKVQPPDLAPEDIDVNLGAPWVDQSYVQQFVQHLLGFNRGIEVSYTLADATWEVEATDKFIKNSSANLQVWGVDIDAVPPTEGSLRRTGKTTAIDLIEAALNYQKIKVQDVFWNDFIDKEYKRTHKALTVAVNEKISEIQEEFKKWLWEDETRRDTLVAQYNEEYNNLRRREYDGSHLTLPGSVIELYPHQKNAIWRVISGGNTLLAHAVGAGKTWEMVASAMEMRRLGIAKKPLLVVPNHMVEQFGAEFMQLYPAANILVMNKSEFSGDKRKKWLTRIATGDYDAVIIAHSTFGLIGLSSETQEQFYREQIDILDYTIQQQVARGERSGRGIAKRLVKLKEKLVEKMQKMLESQRRDDTITFEELGIDALFVDEAHEFKNLLYSSSLNNVGGMGDKDGSVKSFDLYMKIRHLQELNGGRGIVFATGTPISNTVAELFHMQRYLQPKDLQQKRIEHFDAWSKMFASIKNVVELSPTGDGYRTKERIAEFQNAPELLQMFWQFADVLTSKNLDDMKRPDGSPMVVRPKLINSDGENAREQVAIEPSDALIEKVKELGERAEAMSGQRGGGSDNMLKVTVEGRMAALDMRLIDVEAADDPNAKIPTVANEVFKVWEETKENRSTQLIFLDDSTPNDDYKKIKKGEGKNPGATLEFKLNKGEYVKAQAVQAGDEVRYVVTWNFGNEKKGYTSGKSQPVDLNERLLYDLLEEASNSNIRAMSAFRKIKYWAGEPTLTDLYSDIRERLIAKGIPANEIAFIYDYPKDEQKMELFNKVNRGDIRILMGSSKKMGAGMNVQRKLIALHHASIPYRPLDIEQREGRILRQGNENKEVKVFNYSTKKSFDAYMWQLILNKATFTNQIMQGDISVRRFVDEGDLILDSKRARALANDNPLMMEQLVLDDKYEKLLNQQAVYDNQVKEMQRGLNYMPDEIRFTKERLDKTRSDAEHWKKNETTGDKFKITIDGKVYTDRGQANAALEELHEKTYIFLMKGETKKIGEIAGFDIHAQGESKTLTLAREGLYQSSGSIGSIEANLRQIPEHVKNLEQELADKQKELTDLKERVNKPWPKEKELSEVRQQRAEVYTQLGLDENGDTIDEFDETEDLGSMEDRLAKEADSVKGGGVGFSPFGNINANPKITKNTDSRYQKKQAEHAFDDEDIEKRFQDAKLTQESYLSKLKEGLAEMKKGFTREFKELPHTAEFSQIRFKLLELEKQRGVSADRTFRLLEGIILRMNRNQFDLFRRKVVLDDLWQEYEAGNDLPFGFDEESLERNKQVIDAAVERDDAVKKAVVKRKQVWKSVKKSYIEAHDAIGNDMRDRLSKDDYFRHQVIAHAQKRTVKGTGKKVRNPVQRGFLRKREGSEMDINTDYLQAESEVMAQMLYDIEVAKAIKLVDDEYNTQKTLDRQAKKHNEATLDAMIDAQKKLPNAPMNKDGEPFSQIEEDMKVFKRKMGMSFSQLSGMTEHLWTGENGEFEGVVASLDRRVPDDDDLDTSVNRRHPQMFQYLAALAKLDKMEGVVQARTILKAVSQRRGYVKDTLGAKFKKWQDMIPKGYVIWQPQEGNVFYQASVLDAKKAEEIANSIFTQLGVEVTPDDIRTSLVVGGRRREFVVKEEVAVTLDDIFNEPNTGAIYQVSKQSMSFVKQFLLLGPTRIIKYNLRNLTGDLDKLFAANPKALTQVPKSVKELAGVFFRDKALSPELKQWFQRGGMQTLLSAQELQNVNELKMFIRFLDHRGKVTELPVKAWNSYWRNAKLVTDFRESIFRYANYLEYLRQIDKNNGGRPDNYGASIPEEINALSDNRDKAFKLANEVLIAYDATSANGRELRDHWIPFWSWIEGNMKTYIQVFKNAARDEKIASAVGRKLLGTAVARSPYVAYRLGSMVIKVVAISALLAIWNATVMGDEDDELPEDVRNRAHITLGRDKNGKVIYFDRLGALGDFLEWFGLDSTYNDMQTILDGKKSWAEVAQQNVMKPLNKAVNALNPVLKTGAELVSGFSFFPNAFKPSPIRDRWEHFIGMFGLNKEFEAVQDALGGRPVGKYQPENLVIYKADTLQTAYYETLDKKREFMKKIGKASFTGSFESPKTDALYNVKQAIRHGDAEAFDKFLTEYVLAGGTDRGLQQSLDNMSPDAGLTKNEKKVFIEWLSKEDLEKYLKADQFYNETLLGKKPKK